MDTKLDTPFLEGDYQFDIHFCRIIGDVHIKTDWYHNIIVNNGRLNILNRLQSNTYGPILGMGIGTGTGALALANNTLTTETVRNGVSASVNGSPNWNTSFTASYTATQINGSTEIGLFDNATLGSGTMLTRSTYPTISVPPGTNIGINYMISLNTGFLSAGWTLTSGKTYTYQTGQTQSVLGIIETDTGNGYIKETSTASVESTANSYYYDGSNYLYINCSDGLNPSTHTIMVLNGAT